MASIGMMDGAYFVSRSDILSWINESMQLNVSKVEEAASGAIACQLIDATHPGTIQMHRVNYGATSEYEMVQNYKVLQDAFDRLRVAKHIEVNKLVKGRAMDNLEFLQWLKRYCDSVNGNAPNSRVEASRYPFSEGAVIIRWKEEKRPEVGKKSIEKSVEPRTSPPPRVTHREGQQPQLTADVPMRYHVSGNSISQEAGRSLAKKTGALKHPLSLHNHQSPVYEKQVQDLMEQVTELKLSLDGVERERDFYFSKLRDIEILCQTGPAADNKVGIAVKKILYATDDNEDVMNEAQQAMMNMDAEDMKENIGTDSGIMA